MKRYQIILFVFFAFFGAEAFAQKNNTKPSVQGPPGFKVNSFSGNLSYKRRDFGIESIGPDLLFEFNFKSEYRHRDRGFGPGWVFNLDKFYTIDSNQICIEGTKGGKKTFTNNGGMWSTAAGTFDKLVEVGAGEFRLTDKLGNQCYFENAIHKRMTRMVDRCQNQLSFTYSDSLLISVTDQTGRVIQLEWDQGKLAMVYHDLLSERRQFIYEYDEMGRLKSMTNPIGDMVSYAYDSENRMITAVNENNTPTTIAYQQSGGVKQIASCDLVMSFSYNQVKSETYVVEQVGRETVITTYRYDGEGRLESKEGNCCGFNQSFVYDENSNIIKRVNGNGDATILAYDAMGNIISKTDPMGVSTSMEYDPTYNLVTQDVDENSAMTLYEYDGKGNLVERTNALNISSTSTYSPDGRVLTETDGKNLTTTYKYDAYGYLTEIKYPDGTRRNKTNDAVGNITSITDENGHTAQIFYDELDRLVLIVDAMGDSVHHTHNGIGNVISTTDALGNTIQYEYDGVSRLLSTTTAEGIVASNKYDAVGNVIERVDGNGNVHKIEYNNRRQVTAQINPQGNRLEMDYDAVGNKISETDHEGNTINYLFDANNQMTEKILPNGSTYTFNYDNVGRIISETDPKGFTVQYEYDLIGRKIVETDQLGNDIQNTYDDNDNLIEVIDKKGNLEVYSYDLRNRLIKIEYVLGHVVQLAYDSAGNRVMESLAPGFVRHFEFNDRNQLIKSITPGGLMTTHEYDAAERKIKTIESNGNEINFVYDADDRLVRKYDSEGQLASYLYDGNNNVVRRIDQDSIMTFYAYDALNNLLYQENENGARISSTYDGNGRVVSQTSAENETTEITYNNVALPIESIDALGNSTFYEYDENGQLITITDAKGQVNQFNYDAFGRELLRTYADGTTTSYEYDKTGNVIKRIDRDGIECEYTYDAFDRQISKNYLDGTSCTFSYDSLGRMTTANNPEVNISFNYDFNNRLIREQVGSDVLSITYDDVNQEKTITYPSGSVIIEELDNRRRPNAISKNSSLVASFEYHGSRLKSKTLGNGIVTNYTYTNTGLTESMVAQPASIFDFQYAYNSNDFRTTTAYHHKTDRSELNVYNAQNALVQQEKGTLANQMISSPIKSEEFTYDALGNRNTSEMDGIATMYSANNLNQYSTLSSGGGTTNIIYSDNGDLANDGSHSYLYDCDKRLKQIDNIVFKFDALGRRYKRITPTDSTLFYYYQDQLIWEDNVVADDKEHVFVGMGDRILTTEIDGNAFYYHQDPTGNVIATTNETSELIERYEYDVFGNVHAFDSVYVSQPLSDLPAFLFQGKYLDRTAWTYYFTNRNYHPTLGRFMQCDPLGVFDGLNLYQFVDNNPINFIDPQGLTCEKFSLNGGGRSKTSGAQMSSTFGRIGPVFLTGSFKLSGSAETCVECCKDTDEYAATNSLQAGLSGSLNVEINALEFFPATRGFTIFARTTGLVIFAGAKINGSISGSVNKKRDACGKWSGGGCFKGSFSLTGEVSATRGGGSAKIKGDRSIATAQIGGSVTGSLDAKACIKCEKSGCGYECDVSQSASSRLWYSASINVLGGEIQSSYSGNWDLGKHTYKSCVFPQL